MRNCMKLNQTTRFFRKRRSELCVTSNETDGFNYF